LRSPLFDADRFRRHIEAAYLTVWEIWQRGESPRSFRVEAVPEFESYTQAAIKNGA
jgi:protein O-GlcNAc transferase